MKVINLCFAVVVSSKNTSEFGHLWECVYERMREYIFVKWLMMVYGCDETNGSWFCFIFFRMWWISTITAICIFISLWVCEFILFEGISLHDPLFLLYGVCVYYVSEPAKHVPVCFFSLLLKGCLDFGFIYLKNLFLSFSLLTIIYCFYFITIS